MGVDTPQEDRDPETLALYTEESLEGLQIVEDILVSAEKGDVPSDMLGTLFRTVHTIKGTAGYLSYTRTQALSHNAEDLLSKMRDGKILATSPHYSCLIDVSDRLKTLVTNVKATGEEGDVEVDSLIRRLTQLSAPQINDQGIVPGSSAPSSVSGGSSVGDHNVIETKTSELVTPPVVSSGKVDGDSESKEIAVAGVVETVDGTVRVNVGVLDRLMDLIGELVLARNQMVQMVKTTSDGNVSTQSVFQRLNVVTSDLQEQVMKTRMQPVARVFEKIPRIVRDVSRVTSKQVNTIIEGNATEIDKALVEAIRDPVMHIVRNAVDHGIETEADRVAAGKSKVGSLFIRAAHKGGAVTIEVEDDGKGMDPSILREHAVRKGVISASEAAKLSDRDALELVFRPGFSTARQVSDISGRGVGMDVVRTHVERAGGKAEIESTPGRGTIIRLKMPLTMAIIPALLVRARHQRFAIPQANLLELVYLTEEQRRVSIETIRGAAIHKLRGEFIPVVDLSRTLGLCNAETTAAKPDTNIVILSSGARRYSLIVDAIENTEEIVLKPLRGQLKRIPCYSGATVLGDGGVALILDVPGMAAKSGIDLAKDYKPETIAKTSSDVDTELVMIFTIGRKTQCAVPLSMVARLEQIEKSKIEILGDTEVFQYRNKVVPILRPEEVVNGVKSQGTQDSQLLIVFDFGTPVAMAVEEVIDVGHIPKNLDAPDSFQKSISGKTVIFGKATLVLDIYNLVNTLRPHHKVATRRNKLGLRVLTLLPAAAMRSSIETILLRAGIHVTSCFSSKHILKELRESDSNLPTVVVADPVANLADPVEQLSSAQAISPNSPVVYWGDGIDGVSDATSAAHMKRFAVDERDQLVDFLFGFADSNIKSNSRSADHD